MTKNIGEEGVSKIEDLIKRAFPEPEGKTEAWAEIDRLVNIKFLHTALDKLPKEYHEEFAEIFVDNPNNGEKVFEYLEEKAGKDVREEMTAMLSDISKELTEFIEPDRETDSEIGSEDKPPVK